MARLLLFALLAASLASAQLLPGDRPLPRTAAPPVVFLNGYQPFCPTSSFEGTFGQADAIFQQAGRVTLFFNNCQGLFNRPSIEALGNQLGQFLSALRYTDGQPVPQVDIVAHSMGGLIVRSYLAGKQETAGQFTPPADPHIRKVVFLGTPHWGTNIALGFGADAQLDELSTGSRFLWDLNTWNQGLDDLRGIEALALLGNQSNGVAQPRRAGDGVTPLTSGSLEFALTDHTRVLPYCHVGGITETLGQFCTDGVPGIAKLTGSTQDVAQSILSFLDGTEAWRGIGAAPAQNSFLQQYGGLYVAWKTANDQWLSLSAASISTGQPTAMTIRSDGQIAYREFVTAGPGLLALFSLQSDSRTRQETISVTPGRTQPVIVKDGPVIARIYPSAAAITPLALAPGMLISVYGTNLAGATVLVDNQPLTLSYVSANQINTRLPAGLSAAGAPKVTVRTSAGEQSVTALVERAGPAIFTSNGSGEGAAAAQHGITYALVTEANPLISGEIVSLYLTGLNGQQPTVNVGGAACPVLYAGAAPGFPGLDQINCQIPSTVHGVAPVTVTAAGRTSNVVTLAVR